MRMLDAATLIEKIKQQRATAMNFKDLTRKRWIELQ
jgi:hypothetical protein